jgi:pyruvate,orthophosphate dikinase
MVFGNMGDTSATGVAFTRNPATGENKFYGEWLVNAQGEDVVAGIRTPSPLNDDTKNDQISILHSMQEALSFFIRNLMIFATFLKKLTKICLISSSPFRKVNYTCYNAVLVNVPVLLH